MTAHLHRYGSELALLADVVQDIKRCYDDFHELFEDRKICTPNTSQSLCQGIGLITTQLSAISRFRDELQLKTNNVLALVSLQLLRWKR